MLFQSKIRAAVVVPAVAAAMIAMMAFWIARESSFLLERGRLADVVVEHLFRLANDVESMARHDAFETTGHGNRDPAPRAALRDRIDARMVALKRAIANEIAYVRDHDAVEGEKDELEALAAIERDIRELEAARRSADAMLVAGQQEIAWSMIESARRDVLERRILPRIESAIANELAERAEADAESGRLTLYWQIASLLVFALVVVASAIGTTMVARRFRDRISALLSATKALAAGEVTVRVTTAGDDELASLADSFNRMASTIGSHQEQLRASRDSLEIIVAERTEQLRDVNAALARNDRTRKRFFADISHELRTPLTVIRGEAEVMLRGAPKSVDEYQTTLRYVVVQVEQLTRLVDDLLQIARADAGISISKRQAVAVGVVLADACTDAETLGRAKSVEIRLSIATKDPVVLGDRARLRQLFVILLDNAVRYSLPGGEVAVDVLASPAGIVVRVADHGVGIPADEVEYVFERFYRGSNAAEHAADGSGLGLPVAKAIAEAHHGDISIESVLNEGTIVTVRLPTANDMRSVA